MASAVWRVEVEGIKEPFIFDLTLFLRVEWPLVRGEEESDEEVVPVDPFERPLASSLIACMVQMVVGEERKVKVRSVCEKRERERAGVKERRTRGEGTRRERERFLPSARRQNPFLKGKRSRDLVSFPRGTDLSVGCWEREKPSSGGFTLRSGTKLFAQDSSLSSPRCQT